jgi:hypothetical protein
MDKAIPENLKLTIELHEQLHLWFKASKKKDKEKVYSVTVATLKMAEKEITKYGLKPEYHKFGVVWKFVDKE